MAIEVHVPNKSYDGYYGGVRFTKGVGIFEDEILGRDLAERYQYEVVEIKEKEVAEVAAKPSAEVEVVEKPKRKRKPKAGE